MAEILKTFYIKIEPKAVHVQEKALFVGQGGTIQPWGKEWRAIEATGIEAARQKGLVIRDLENDAAAS